MNKLLLPTLLAITATIVPAVSKAASVSIIPENLNSGDKYRLVFLTSSTTSAISDNIDTYNDFVSQRISLANNELTNLNTSWFAIVSTDNVDAISNTNTAINISDIPIYLVTPNGTPNELVAEDYGDFWDGSINSPINNTEQGAERPNVVSWTGTQTDGTKTGNPLGSNDRSSFGFVNSTNTQWIENGSPITVNNVRSVYGISDVLEVPQQTPETNPVFGILMLGWIIPLTKVKYK
ncbi:MAG: hypothetical protein AB4041_07785 [Microcystaceae cyanobacterium]